MVEAVTPISPIVSSSPTKVHTSTSISSEPDNAWIAARQSVITAGLPKLKRSSEKDRTTDGDHHNGAEAEIASDHTLFDRAGEEAPEEQHRIEEIPDHATLSGESERTGTSNFDEGTPFGERTAIV